MWKKSADSKYYGGQSRQSGCLLSFLDGFLILPLMVYYKQFNTQAGGHVVSSFQIKEALQEIRKQRTEGGRCERQREFIELLEGRDCCRGTVYSTEQLCFICDAYIRKLLDTYLFDPQKVEIVLAAFGMLEGCSISEPYSRRHIWYINHAFGVNEYITQSWYDEAQRGKDNNPRKKEDDSYFVTIAENLMQTGRVGALGLFDSITTSLQKDYPEGIPAKITPATPKYIQKKKTAQTAAVEDLVAASACDTADLPKKKPAAGRKWPLSACFLAASLLCLVASVGMFLSANQNDNTIQSISVLNPDVTLYPGGYERLQIATVPDDTDRSVLECHSDSNPWITATKTADWVDTNAWTEAWSVAAERDWEETLPYSGKVSVMGGEATPVYIDVTVEEPAYKTESSAEELLSGSNDTSDAGEYTAP